jgi:hypothetical protein
VTFKLSWNCLSANDVPSYLIGAGCFWVLDSRDAFVVMKLTSKQSISLENGMAEIQILLCRDRTLQEFRKATDSGKAEFKLNYLGMSSACVSFPPPVLAQLPGQKGMLYGFVYRTSSR